MTLLSRRMVLTSVAAAGLGALWRASPAKAGGSARWIEVMGSASASGPNDRDAARRRALGDALLSAALAGGAVVKGHSVLSNTRLTSDLLVVRPLASVLSHRVVWEEFDGRVWRVKIAAQVGAVPASYCGDRRQMFVTMYPPRIRVSPSSPAWAEALAVDLATRLAALAEAHPAVADLTRVDRLPNDNPSRDRGDYRVLTTGDARVAAGGHGLHCDIEVEPMGPHLQLSLRLRIEGPAGERMEKTHVAAVRLPGPSLLGNAAVLISPDRQKLAHRLATGARPAMTALLTEAGCKPVLARIHLSGQSLVVPVGRAHGVKRTHLAFTVDADASTELLEVVTLSDRTTGVSPLDPTRSFAAFAGRPVRFLDTADRV